MSAKPYVIAISADVSPSRSFDQRFYHAKEPLLRGDQYFCQYGDDPKTHDGYDRLVSAGETLANLLCDTLGVRQFTIHNYHVGVLKGEAFDWEEVEPRIVGTLLFAIHGGERFVAALRYHQLIPNEFRLQQWTPISQHYGLLCREAGIDPLALQGPELRSIDLDAGPAASDPPEPTSE